MNETGIAYSKAAVSGFILAVAPHALFLLIGSAGLFIHYYFHFHIPEFSSIYLLSVIVCGVVSIVFGWIFSIMGLITTTRINLKGRGLAKTAIIFLVLETLTAYVALVATLPK